MPTSDSSDEELLTQIIDGDEAAFTSLYRRRQASVYRFALRMSGSEAIAEDVTQETFMAVVDDARRFDASRGTLAAYMYGIARNRLRRRLERDHAYVPLDEGAEPPQTIGLGATPGVDPLGSLARAETADRVRSAVLALPSHYREVVVLCELEELSYAAAAGVLGCSVGTIRSRLARGRALLTEKLRAQESGHTSPAKATRCFA